MRSANQRALAFGMRCNVSKSTWTMPKRCGVALGPLEVVEVGPHEEPAQIDTLAHRRVRGRGSARPGMRHGRRRRSRRPVRVVVEDGSVLVHVDRRRFVLGGEPDECLAQAIGFDRPTTVRRRDIGCNELDVERARPHARARRRRGTGRVPHVVSPVVVETQRVDRTCDLREITVANVIEIGDRLEVFEHVLGILAAEHRVVPQAVRNAVDAARGVAIGVAVPGNDDRVRVRAERDIGVAHDARRAARRRRGRARAAHGARPRWPNRGACDPARAPRRRSRASRHTTVR